MSPSLHAGLVGDLHGRTPGQVEAYANEALVRPAGGDTVFLSYARERAGLPHRDRRRAGLGDRRSSPAA